MLKKIILISGKAQHGKDTFAQMLKEELEQQDQKVCIVHYAKYLKSILRDYYGWDGVNKDEYWRKMLQYIGTDKIRCHMNNPFFHVNRVMEDIYITADDFDFYIILFWQQGNKIN